MTRPYKYHKPMSTLVALITTEAKEILKRNADENKSVTKMVQDAIDAYIVQHNLR